jgi:hypothetical protein
VSLMILACIAVLAVVGLAFYAIHREAGLKVSARALRGFEVSIEVAAQSGPHHNRPPIEPGDDLRGLGQPDNRARADGRVRSNQLQLFQREVRDVRPVERLAKVVGELIGQVLPAVPVNPAAVDRATDRE